MESNEIAVVDVEPVVKASQISNAKTSAVAALVGRCYERAGTLELTKEESDALLEDFPDSAFRPGAAGKENLIYIEHADLRDRLNQVFGLGRWSLIPVRHWTEEFSYRGKDGLVEGVKVYCEAVLIIRGAFVGSAIGDMDYYPKNLSTNYGDAYEGAKTAAFRRCAKEFGIGLQAWRKNWCEGWWARRGNAPQQSSGSTGGYTGEKPTCPACKSSAAVFKSKNDDSYYCWKKYTKHPGCGHQWTPGVTPSPESEPDMDLLKQWEPRVESATAADLKGMYDDYRKIPGQHKKRAAIWKLIVTKAKRLGYYAPHGAGGFVPLEREPGEDG